MALVIYHGLLIVYELMLGSYLALSCAKKMWRVKNIQGALYISTLINASKKFTVYTKFEINSSVTTPWLPNNEKIGMAGYFSIR